MQPALEQPELTVMHPLHDDILVIGLVPDAWPSPWMARHHVMTRLGKYFRVLWINPAKHIQCALRDHVEYDDGFYKLGYKNGFSVVNLKTPSVYGPRMLARLLLKLQCREIDSAIRKYNPSKVVVYVWRYAFKEMLDMIECDHICYHIDDEYSFSREIQSTCRQEKEMLSIADHVFIHSPELYHKKSDFSSSSHLLPMGADFRLYSTPTCEPDDIKLIPKPRIGYIGYIKGQLDFETLCEVASMNRNYSFVFIGPENKNMAKFKIQMEDLRSHSNVYLLGQRDTSMLGAYMQHMDVLLLPYRVDNYTRYISPMKLNEYLATGRPVVASPISYLKQFSNIISFAETPEQWSEMIHASLGAYQNSYHEVKKRQVVAAQSDWDKITHRIASFIASDMGRNIPMLMDIPGTGAFKFKRICEVVS